MMYATPETGTKVRVTTSRPNYVVGREDDVSVYEGIVLQPERWLTADQFVLSGDDHIRIRIISVKNVIDLRNESGNELMQADEVEETTKTWIVLGSKGKEYTVTRREGKMTCTCPGFQFRKQCRHIVEKSAEN